MKLRALLSSLVILVTFTGVYCYGASIPAGELGPGHVLTVVAIAAVSAVAIWVIGWTR